MPIKTRKIFYKDNWNRHNMADLHYSAFFTAIDFLIDNHIKYCGRELSIDEWYNLFTLGEAFDDITGEPIGATNETK